MADRILNELKMDAEELKTHKTSHSPTMNRTGNKDSFTNGIQTAKTRENEKERRRGLLSSIGNVWITMTYSVRHHFWALLRRWRHLRLYKRIAIVIPLVIILLMSILQIQIERQLFLTEECAFGNDSIAIGNSILHFGDKCLRYNLLSPNTQKSVLEIFMNLHMIGNLYTIQTSTEDTLVIDFRTCELTISYIKVTNSEEPEKSSAEYSIDWTCARNFEITNAVSLQDSHWYGGTISQGRHTQNGTKMVDRIWPMKQFHHPIEPYVTRDSFRGQYGGVMERYWLASSGVALYVNDDVPLFVGFSADQYLVLQANWQKPFVNLNSKLNSLSYKLFQAGDVLATHKMASSQVFARPKEIPKLDLFRYPIWSTWMIYEADVTQMSVIQFAKDIKKYGFNISQLELDDKWSVVYGEFKWDNRKFPNPKEMTSTLNQMDIPLTLWVHPFTSLLSTSSFSDIWVRGGFGMSIIMWWDSFGYALDFTNKKAVDWFLDNLNKFKELYGIHSFKFDGGESIWLPPNPVFSKPLQDLNDYTRIYAKIAAQSDTVHRAQEVRVGTRTQHLPMFVRIMDKKAIWSDNNGLLSIIPTVLTYGILGYPFVLPDIIGGNTYFPLPQTSKELYIRWAQLCALLPVMQFSYPPWYYDQETIAISINMTHLHYHYSDLLIKLAQDFLKTGEPIIRPLWWIAPHEEPALTTDTQFLVGNNLMVAPVLQEGALSRDIYLPSSRWRDMRGAIFEGPKWLKDYKAELHELPYFTRMLSSDI